MTVIVGAPALRGNDWTVLVPEPGAQWTPTKSVSVCIPTSGITDGLRRTIAALDAQTYPRELLQIVVGVDGEADDTEELGSHVTVVSRPSVAGFGAGRARNTAARASTGDIIVFLDADVIPDRRVVEVYARWLHRSDLSVPLGFLRFVDIDDLTIDEVVDVIRGDDTTVRFSGRDVDDQDYRDRTLERTNDLRRETIDAFRLVVGASLAVSRRMYWDVGGFPERGVRGIEDTEFGYRLHNNGAILIPDRDARHWHQGRRHINAETRADVEEQRAPYVERLIPIPGFRRGEPSPNGPVETVPVYVVHVGPGPDNARRITSDSVERADGCNCIVSDEPFDPHRFDAAFGHVFVPAGLIWGSATRKALTELFRGHAVGVITALPDDERAGEVVAIRTRAVRRAVAVSADDDPIDLAAVQFGRWWTTLDRLDIDDEMVLTTEREMPRATSHRRRLQRASRRAVRRAEHRMTTWSLERLRRWSA